MCDYGHVCLFTSASVFLSGCLSRQMLHLTLQHSCSCRGVELWTIQPLNLTNVFTSLLLTKPEGGFPACSHISGILCISKCSCHTVSLHNIPSLKALKIFSMVPCTPSAQFCDASRMYTSLVPAVISVYVVCVYVRERAISHSLTCSFSLSLSLTPTLLSHTHLNSESAAMAALPEALAQWTGLELPPVLHDGWRLCKCLCVCVGGSWCLCLCLEVKRLLPFSTPAS